jgi:8-hydroxy-5-deazaflavin:NADPH oxidoreductase
VFGTGPVGQALAGKLAEVGHDVTVGTRDPAATLARTESGYVWNPPFGAWLDAQPEVGLEAPAVAAIGAEMVVNATNGAGSIGMLELAGRDNLAGKVLPSCCGASAGPVSASVTSAASPPPEVQRCTSRSGFVSGARSTPATSTSRWCAQTRNWTSPR